MVLGLCYGDTGMYEHARYMLDALGDMIYRYPTSFGMWAIVKQRGVHEYKSIVCTGMSSDKNAQKILSYQIPEAYILRTNKQEKELPILADKQPMDVNAIFVCTIDSCLPPVSDLENIIDLINYYHP